MAENIAYEFYYRQLFEAHYASLVNFACRYVRKAEVAEDLVQNVFVAMWNAKIHFDDRVQMRNYLFRALIHGVYNHERHRHVQERGMSVLMAAEQDDAALQDAIYEHELWCRVAVAVEKLPDRCREICRMTLDGKKPSEIAQVLNLSVETVKKQKQIAIRKLRNHFGELVLLLLLH